MDSGNFRETHPDQPTPSQKLITRVAHLAAIREKHLEKRRILLEKFLESHRFSLLFPGSILIALGLSLMYAPPTDFVFRLFQMHPQIYKVTSPVHPLLCDDDPVEGDPEARTYLVFPIALYEEYFVSNPNPPCPPPTSKDLILKLSVKDDTADTTSGHIIPGRRYIFINFYDAESQIMTGPLGWVPYWALTPLSQLKDE